MNKAVEEALTAVVKSAPSEEAKSYARVALKFEMSGDKLKSQILYVRSNLFSWKGAEAREVKKTLVAATS